MVWTITCRVVPGQVPPIWCSGDKGELSPTLATHKGFCWLDEKFKQKQKQNILKDGTSNPDGKPAPLLIPHCPAPTLCFVHRGATLSLSHVEHILDMCLPRGWVSPTLVCWMRVVSVCLYVFVCRTINIFIFVIVKSRLKKKCMRHFLQSHTHVLNVTEWNLHRGSRYGTIVFWKGQLRRKET